MFPVILLAACAPKAIDGTQVRMDFGDGFWTSPFPSEERRHDDGTVDVSGFPNPDGNGFAGTVLALVDGHADGFGTTSAVYLPTTGPVGPLPDLFASTSASSPVFLEAVDGDHAGERVPVQVTWTADGGPYGGDDEIAVLPLQGAPLEPSTTYAAVVLRSLGDADGDELGVSLNMATLARGKDVDGLSDDAAASYADALTFLDGEGVAPDDVAGLAVFRTGDPRQQLQVLVDDALARPMPTPSGFAKTDDFDGYCVYHATIDLPVYQQGTPPYLDGGGGIVLQDGVPVVDHTETAAFWVTVPRQAMPADGWPTVVMIPTGGGGDRPLVDRGTHATPHGDAIEPGTGPARWFAMAGFAGVSVDGPHGGMRNVTGGDQQLLMFNMGNPTAMLDNFRESDVEVALQAHLLDDVTFDASDCDGATPTVTFDTSKLALFGHSMGATIAGPVLGVEPRYRAAVLSGAGGSWLENVIWKQSPLAVKPVAETIIGYGDYDRELTEDDPILSMVQWAGEATDPPVYASDVGGDVLMFQGIVDTYILPPMAEAWALPLGVQLGGPEYDTDGDERLAPFRTWQDLADVGAGTVQLPASGNVDGSTKVLVQHLEDGLEDGHEVVFQTEAPKHQYRCFLQSYREDGLGVVVPDGSADDDCR